MMTCARARQQLLRQGTDWEHWQVPSKLEVDKLAQTLTQIVTD